MPSLRGWSAQVWRLIDSSRPSSAPKRETNLWELCQLKNSCAVGVFGSIEAKHGLGYSEMTQTAMFCRWSFVAIFEDIILTRTGKIVGCTSLLRWELKRSAIQMRKIVKKFLPHVQCLSMLPLWRDFKQMTTVTTSSANLPSLQPQ